MVSCAVGLVAVSLSAGHKSSSLGLHQVCHRLTNGGARLALDTAQYSPPTITVFAIKRNNNVNVHRSELITANRTLIKQLKKNQKKK